MQKEAVEEKETEYARKLDQKPLRNKLRRLLDRQRSMSGQEYLIIDYF